MRLSTEFFAGDTIQAETLRSLVRLTLDTAGTLSAGRNPHVSG